MITTSSWRVLAGCVAGLALWPASASAVPEFPHTIQRGQSLSYEPPCGVCHVKGNTGIGTAETPFALALRERGLMAGDDHSLTSALTALEKDGVDSDGDGVIDVDELSEGTDPNSPGKTKLKGRLDPKWGCSIASAPAPTPAQPHQLAALGLALPALLLATRRKRAR